MTALGERPGEDREGVGQNDFVVEGEAGVLAAAFQDALALDLSALPARPGGAPRAVHVGGAPAADEVAGGWTSTSRSGFRLKEWQGPITDGRRSCVTGSCRCASVA